MALRGWLPRTLVAAVPAAALACATAQGVDSAPECPECAGAPGAGGESAGVDAATSDDAARRADGTPDAQAGDGRAPGDGSGADGAAVDSGARDASPDAGDGGDASTADGGAADSGSDSATGGVVTGGPCISGAQGATAFRIRWTNGGGRAIVSYEVEGLPDRSRSKAGAYGYQIGFVPQFVDPFLAQGGLQLDGSSFVDLELSTAGVASITRATLSIYGRSFNTTASGSFNWQTFVGSGSTATNFVSNVAPYQWYSADVTSAVAPNDNGMLVRIKAGPSSGSLVVNRIELCLVAN